MATATVLLSIHGLAATEVLEFGWPSLAAIPGNVARLIRDMLPPDLSVMPRLVPAIIETLQMCLVGTFVGILCSLPLGFLAAANLNPNRLTRITARFGIGLARSVPDLVWAIFFVILVGLGPLAGCLTLMVDTMGFASRFFAEALEEVDPGPDEALRAIGAGRLDRFCVCYLPGALPSLVATTLFSLERAVQSSVVLGLVGAGGIGMLLEEPMTWHDYDQAATIVLAIFLLLLLVERISVRQRTTIIARTGG